MARWYKTASVLGILGVMLVVAPVCVAWAETGLVAVEAEGTFLQLANRDQALPILVDPEDEPAVLRAVEDFRRDVERVTGTLPPLLTSLQKLPTELVIAGSIESSDILKQMEASGVVDLSEIRGRWEAHLIETVDNPLPGVDRALVIAGGDRRGAVFGLYRLSAEIGVSPWYWWADVPVVERDAVFIRSGRATDAPAVQYRGIFLNDEAPALSGWAHEKFGGFNHEFYAHVFELILRLGGNYLWPAMWGNAFADDDSLNPRLADHYGVVIGTSHHEPLMRAHDEWRRYGEGPWDYSVNAERLREFWRDGLERFRGSDTIVTLGMRGDGDEAMSEETNVALLERIVADQREIIEKVTGKRVTDVPQMWALYKEVQEYYERGMRAPDDVILLWADDNWGNIRRLPTWEERQRQGGAGVYYHFDYVGGPRSYKWINVTPITKIWEQMHLAWQYEARRIWIVNVGDLKPMEFPIEFFLDYAWRPEAIAYEDLVQWSEDWARRNFVEPYAGPIARLINGYTKLNRRRTPELLSPDTLSLVNYNEAERVLDEWRELVKLAETVNESLPEAFQAAFFQLVLYPVKASSVVQELYVQAGYNRLYSSQGRAATNDRAERVRALFEEDNALAQAYHSLNDGKWNHMMAQVNLGYRIWQQPLIERMPPVHEVRPHRGAVPAVAIEGSTDSWPSTGAPPAVLPPLDVFSGQTRWIEIFNRGTESFEFRIESSSPWVRVFPDQGVVEDTVRVAVSLKDQAPAGAAQATLTVTANGQTVVIQVPVLNPDYLRQGELKGFVEMDGHISIDALNFTRSITDGRYEWKVLKDFGRGPGAVTIFPVTAPTAEPGDDSPHLEYDLHLFTTGEITVHMHFAPSLDFLPDGLRFGVSLDSDEVRVIPVGTWETLQTWERAVSDSVRVVSSTFHVDEPGSHTLKFWYVTPGVVLEKIIVDTGGLRPSYLGPPQSPRLP